MQPIDLDQLNEQQLEAVTHTEGPLLVLAGAGSGKTRVITYRVAYLLQRGVEPEKILAVSFTNKAADEMRERVAELTNAKLAPRCHLSTFHSLGADILSRDIDVLGYDRPFSILDQSDQIAIVKEAMDELNLDTDTVSPRRVHYLIGRAKMNFCDISGLEGLRYDPILPYAEKVYGHYKRALKGLNAVDFNDLISLPVQLLKENENIQKKYRSKYRHIMVDEYQDSNNAQLRFLSLLVGQHRNIAAVGDDDQSIYGFRGAVAHNILEFEKRFPDARTIKLERNYRSTNRILEASNHLISHNPVRKEKRLWSAKGPGPPIRYVESKTGREEAEFVAAEIQKLKRQYDRQYGDFAVLYRVNPQSRPFEEAFRTYNVPYTVVGSAEFFNRKEIKDYIAYLRTALNPDDELSLRRIVNVPPRGIGPTLLNRLSELADSGNWSFFRALERVANRESNVRGIGRASIEHLNELVETITTFNRRFKAHSSEPEKLADTVASLLEATGLPQSIRNTTDDDEEVDERIGNLEQLVDGIVSFLQTQSNKEDTQGLPALFRYLNKMTLEKSAEAKNRDRTKRVQLMTLHSAKGLEFPCVFLAGVEEDYMPHIKNKDDSDDLAEERRLMYVGMTRAQKRLVLTSAKERTRYGREEKREPSRFLEELPGNTIEVESAHKSESLQKKRQEQNQKYLAAMRSVVFDD